MRINFKHIEVKAIDVLKNNGLYKANFDLQLLCKKLGLELEKKYLGGDISGFLVVTTAKKIITVNNRDIETRQRFTIAHEVGHFLLHGHTQPLFVDKAPKVLFRNAVSATGEDYMEREANAFAAALLMPSELIEEHLEKAPHDISKAITFLAKKFGVSENAMTFRLSNLGYGI